MLTEMARRRPKKPVRSFQKKADSVVVAPGQTFALPLYILISVQHFFSRIFGEECGRGQLFQSGGTYICQNKLRFSLLQQHGSAYQVDLETVCGNLSHRRYEWTSPGETNKGFEVNTIVTLAGRLSGRTYHLTAESLID